uniref:RecF/RecN/SMC N-terminal domain-containing protein n=1 Tax=Gadus morhua TaxID=8049 RepID=A0A8C5FRM6_GADMO
KHFTNYFYTAEEGEAGIVESITLKNFMCHTLLGPFTFGSNVNFVVGNNGSGKSAVLTALIVALGGTAQATNRGASLKGFVKEGESSAEVSVTLRNTGRDAYKLEDYGQAVIIDLKLTRDGMRTFKLKSKSGQIVSTKKEDLMSILDNFNIQVNNPVSILTQEMSKHFLHSKSEGDKYKFFMKATQLEQMKLDFISIKTAKQYTEEKVSQNGEQSGLQKSIDANSRNLLTLKASSSNRLRRFGEHMPGLLKAIQDAHRAGQLKERPRGPLGYCISLKDPQMALAVEVCLKGQLQAFACDNHKDENVLQGLMARVFPSGQRPGIITSRFLDRVHDTSRRGVDHPTYPSVLQSLEVEDPVVANCLIDQRGIERILLIRNCTQAFSVEGDQIFENRSWSAEQSRPNFLFGDVEEEIRHLQREMENQTAQVGCYQQRKQKVEEDIGKNEDLLKKAHVEQKKTQVKRTSLCVTRPSMWHLVLLSQSLNVTCHMVGQASVTKATEICPERLEVRRTARNLDNEINLVKTKITTQQAQQGNREEIVKQYKEAYEKYKDTAQQMKCLKSFIRTLNQIITDRLKAYNSLRSMLSARCKYYFDSLLFQRGYTGSMTFNHNDETLFISVQPGEGDKAELSDMRSLSGGERSFSTVCFVLSLWAITEAPFRCLDEFDVYMDMVNRRISMDMMLKIADSQRYRQFVFLTPQSMSSLPESKFIRILRMKDPERGSQDQASSREDPA